jgi:predicted P-loop ATPase
LVENVIEFEELKKARAEAGIDWLSECQKEGVRVLPTVANALLTLRRDPVWAETFAYDELARHVVLRKPLPDEQANGFESRALRDNDVTHVQVWLQQAGIMRMGRDATFQAVEAVARAATYHPISDYLNGLEWDGAERLNIWTHDCLGTTNDEYSYRVGKCFLISMVARALRPGCKVDTMLVLEGGQGALKSQACRVLAGPTYFSDNLPENVASKDAAVHLRGKWLVELAEMHPHSRSETTALKAFLSRDTDRFRPPYGRCEVIEPRQCVFIGTTNLAEYLIDPTGGRRFWPMRTGTVDLDRLAEWRDQLFAEAVQAFRRGEPWWLSAEFERLHAEPQQEDRQAGDPWDKAVAAYVADKDRVMICEILQFGIGMDLPKIGTHDQNRVRAILTRMKWRRGHREAMSRWWVPPTSQSMTHTAVRHGAS